MKKMPAGLLSLLIVLLSYSVSLSQTDLTPQKNEVIKLLKKNANLRENGSETLMHSGNAKEITFSKINDIAFKGCELSFDFIFTRRALTSDYAGPDAPVHAKLSEPEKQITKFRQDLRVVSDVKASNVDRSYSKNIVAIHLYDNAGTSNGSIIYIKRDAAKRISTLLSEIASSCRN
jgi:hypothetical protein